MDNISSLTASEARENFYNLVKKAAKGLKAYEITLRGSDPVVLIGKAEIESWLETLDVLASPDEAEAITEGRQTQKSISHSKMKKLLGI